MHTPRFSFDTPPAPSDSQPSDDKVDVVFSVDAEHLGMTVTVPCGCSATMKVTRAKFVEISDELRDMAYVSLLSSCVEALCLEMDHGGIVGAMALITILKREQPKLPEAWRTHWRTALGRPAEGGTPS